MSFIYVPFWKWTQTAGQFIFCFFVFFLLSQIAVIVFKNDKEKKEHSMCTYMDLLGVLCFSDYSHIHLHSVIHAGTLEAQKQLMQVHCETEMQ